MPYSVVATGTLVAAPPIAPVSLEQDYKVF